MENLKNKHELHVKHEGRTKMSTTQPKRTDYRNIKIKSGLANDIEKWIQEHPEYGYSSIADVATEAIRLRIMDLKAAARQNHQDQTQQTTRK